jgi:hypothetical protein
MGDESVSEIRKPYTIPIIFEENHNLFKQPLTDKINLAQKFANGISELVFNHLILKGGMQLYLVVLTVLALVMFIGAIISLYFGVLNATITNYVYMFIMLLIIPFLTYFLDVYQAMQLRLGMNLAVREKSWPTLKRKEKRQPSTGKFEWSATNFSILNAIMHEKKRSFSYADFGKIAGVDRQTAAGAVKKLLESGIIYTENDNYYFSGVEFDVWLRKGKNTEPKQLTDDEKRRLGYLFRVMCFVAF